MKCLETNKICSNYNKKCKVCVFDDPRRTYDMTDYEIFMTEMKAREIFENAIPEECKKCTLLDKDYVHKTVRCLYRSKDSCMIDN